MPVRINVAVPIVVTFFLLNVTSGQAQSPKYGRPLADSLGESSQPIATPLEAAPDSSDVSPSKGKSSFSESFDDLIRKANAPESPQSPVTPADESLPKYGKPLADSLAEPSAVSTKQSSTMAPFTRPGGFAPYNIAVPRPLNIPADSLTLKQAATMIANLSVVSPSLLRGAQPNSSGLDLLKKSGVRTVINLRNEPILVAEEAKAVQNAGMNYVNIPMNLFDPPSNKQFQAFLAAVDRGPGPVFVHCMKGEDRTGAMVAAYRVARQGWDVNRAYQEMNAMGFKPYLGVMSAALYDYAASIGRPGRRPPLDLRLTNFK